MSFIKKSDVKNHIFPAHHEGESLNPARQTAPMETVSSPLESGAACPLTISAGKDNLREFPSKKRTSPDPQKSRIPALPQTLKTPESLNREAAFCFPPQWLHPSTWDGPALPTFRRDLDSRGRDRGNSVRYHDPPGGMALHVDTGT